MGSVRWIYNQEDLILKAVLDKSGYKVTLIAIKDKHPLKSSSFLLSISIKHVLKPIQAYLLVALLSR
jgi:hypothetical protein